MIVGDISSKLFNVYNVHLLSYDCRAHHSCHKETRLKCALKAGRGVPSARIDSTWIDATTILCQRWGMREMMPAQVASHSPKALHCTARVVMLKVACVCRCERTHIRKSYSTATNIEPDSRRLRVRLGVSKVPQACSLTS